MGSVRIGAFLNIFALMFCAQFIKIKNFQPKNLTTENIFASNFYKIEYKNNNRELIVRLDIKVGTKGNKLWAFGQFFVMPLYSSGVCCLVSYQI